jgi:hypothetical protein
MAFGAVKPSGTQAAPATPPSKPAATPPVVKPAEVDPWAGLAEAPITPTYERGTRVDVRKDVPKSIRDILEASLAQYGQEITVGGKTLKPKTPKYRDFNAGTVDNAKKLVALMRKYAKYRDTQISVRAFPLKDKAGQDTSVVHFAAMPLQKRDPARLPGTATK